LYFQVIEKGDQLITSLQIDFDSTPGGGAKIQPDASTTARGANPFLSTGNTSGPKRPMLSLGFYAQFFDVDTNEVLRRCWAALYPRAPFLDVLDGNPDLYGPFWIATTVVFILFLAGSINSMWGRLSGDGGESTGFDWALLSGSAGLIYGYTGLVPVGLWAVLRWFGSESANLLECWCLYGYANLIWVPVAFISWSWIDSKFAKITLSIELFLTYVFSQFSTLFSLD
jgi:protein YIPF1/2